MRFEGSDEQGLDALFRAYREACPEVEPSANFMPHIWERIEARQSESFFVGRVARGLVTAAAALTMAMAMWLYVPRSGSAFYAETYIEALAAGHPSDGELYDVETVDPAGQL